MFTSYKNKLSVIKQASKQTNEQFFNRSTSHSHVDFGENPLKIKRHSTSIFELIISCCGWKIVTQTRVYPSNFSSCLDLDAVCPGVDILKSVLWHALKRVLHIFMHLRWFQEILKPFHLEISWTYLLNLEMRLNDRVQWSSFKMVRCISVISYWCCFDATSCGSNE